eukprot:TRINITY_DN3246_c0_g8_i3.p1 TRINITY_DN3246_c0_g8~~TRINITY_DN3246_c0_g8_i3.p1  ORF type:complete len:63 (-),score=5.49 TRINITY_DN3246_c0_g8_i3:143-331(-)
MDIEKSWNMDTKYNVEFYKSEAVNSWIGTFPSRLYPPHNKRVPLWLRAMARILKGTGTLCNT